MPLMTCKDCQKQFSTDAKKCPHCGAKAPIKKTNPLWYLAIVGVLGPAWLLFSMDSGSAPTPSQVQNPKHVQTLTDAVDGAANIKRSMRNPDSFKIAFAAYNRQSNSFCYEYRAQNGFGGVNTEHTILKGQQKFLYEAAPGFSKTWTRECDSAEVLSADTLNRIMGNK